MLVLMDVCSRGYDVGLGMRWCVLISGGIGGWSGMRD